MGRTRFISAGERQKRIEVLMRRKGWTYYRLAEAMGRNETSVRRSVVLKDGRSPDPSVNTIKAIARALGVTAGFLIDRKET